jgi:AcrR family transcriptional regulator
MTAKKSTTTKTKISKDTIISCYMDTVLTMERRPKSIYKFCKENGMTEADFYRFFGSLELLQKEIWTRFFEHTMRLINQSKEYEVSENKEKMLIFFYTFFEMLTANRSYVLFSLKESKDAMKNMSQLKDLRDHIKGFATSLIDERNDTQQLKILKHPAKIFSEGAWLQTLFILKFWMDDSSPSFEKTDLVIEKSVRAIFDVFETTPLESLVDFGKFIWKEKMT